jgi:cysteine desulfurase
MIYFDHNATTPVDERVLDAMAPYLSRLFGNPSSLHRLGRASRAAIDAAREQVAALVGSDPGQVIFTSGGTEANNLAIKGLGFGLDCGTVAIGATEHPAVAEAAAFLGSRGWRAEILSAGPDGAIDPDGFDGLPLEGVRFASIMWANNETGVINDIPRLAAATRRRGALLHCDAVQAAGKIPVDFASSGVHLMSLSSHKMFGPKGAGALIVDPSVSLVPQLHGGGQERGLRGGTENVPALVGFGRAAEIARLELEERRRGALHLRQLLEAGLREISAATVFAESSNRLPNTVQFALSGYDGEMMVMLLDRAGFAVSSGSACASGGHEPSPVLLAMGVDAQDALGAVRVSLGPANSEADIDRFLAVIRELAAPARARSGAALSA